MDCPPTSTVPERPRALWRPRKPTGHRDCCFPSGRRVGVASSDEPDVVTRHVHDLHPGTTTSPPTSAPVDREREARDVVLVNDHLGADDLNRAAVGLQGRNEGW
ncbi:MAG: hypothetical protein M3364_08750 [Actinomycetota bacterium]|nr:hypothetical protein [Actinomycetota bacterium]